jgi:hypothetical protein
MQKKKRQLCVELAKEKNLTPSHPHYVDARTAEQN